MTDKAKRKLDKVLRRLCFSRKGMKKLSRQPIFFAPHKLHPPQAPLLRGQHHAGGHCQGLEEGCAEIGKQINSFHLVFILT